MQMFNFVIGRYKHFGTKTCDRLRRSPDQGRFGAFDIRLNN